MRQSRRPSYGVGLLSSVLLGALSFTGCGPGVETGTAVKDTPEAVAGRQASMEGMKKAMESQKAPKK